MQDKNKMSNQEPLLRQTNKFVDSADLLNVVGNNKLYQKRLLVYYVVAQFFFMIIFTSIPFIFYSPSFHCTNQDGTSKPCSEAEACASNNFTVSTERISFITKFQLYCDRNHLQTLSKNIIFLFAAGGCFILSILSDFIGRKSLFILSSILIITGCILGLQNNLIMAVAGTAMSFLALDLYFTFTYIYTNEIVGADYRSRFLPLMQFFGSAGAIASSGISLLTISYWHIFVLNLIVNGGLSLLAFYFVETPFVLNKRKDKQPLFNTLCYINDINNKNMPDVKHQNVITLKDMIWSSEDVTVVDANAEPHSLTDNRKKSKGPSQFFTALYNLKNILKLFQICCIFLNIFILLGLPLVAAQHIGNGNIQLNAILFSVIQMLGFMYSFKYAHQIRRKMLNIGFAILTVLIPGLLFLNSKTLFFGQSFKIWMDLALSVIMVCAAGTTNSLISTYTSELFPTAIRGLAVGAGLFIGRSSFVVSNYLTNMGVAYGVNPICFCAVPGTVALICASMLHETLNRKVKS